MNLLGLTEPPQPSSVGTGKGIDARSWGSLSPGTKESWLHGRTFKPAHAPQGSRPLGAARCCLHSCSAPGQATAGPPSSLPPRPGLQHHPSCTSQSGEFLPSHPALRAISWATLGAPQGHSWASSHSGIAPQLPVRPPHIQLGPRLTGVPPNPSRARFTLPCSEDTIVRAVLHPWGLWENGLMAQRAQPETRLLSREIGGIWDGT